MVQISTRVLVAALAAAPALAIPLSRPIAGGVATREVEFELDARQPFLGSIFRKVGSVLGITKEKEVEGRDFSDELLEIDARDYDEAVADLEARNPFLGKIFGGIKSFLGFRRDMDELDVRAFEDQLLEARDLLDEVDIRELDEFVVDLEARNPFLGKIFGGIKSFLGFRREVDEDLISRQYDEAVVELEARNPFLGKIFGGIKSFLGFRRDMDELDVRDFEDELLEARDLLDEVDIRELDEFVGELEARNPFLGKIFGGIKSFLGFRRESLESEFEAREFDIEEIDARDFDFEEIDARDFFDFEDFEVREIDELD